MLERWRPASASRPARRARSTSATRLSAVANRRFGDRLLLRIDDTDAARNVPGGEEAILRDLEWLGLDWDEGPVRQSERQERYREAAARLGVERFDGDTLLREDGTATYHLASVVDDADFGITHVVRGNDHRPNEALHRRLREALGAAPPEYVHHGLILGPDGKKLSKRHGAATVADLREAGIPAEAVRAYLEELGLPQHDVHYDQRRHPAARDRGDRRAARRGARRRAGAPLELVPALRGARDLVEARALRAGDPRAGARRAPGEARADARAVPRAPRRRANGALDADAARRSCAS